MGVTLWLCRHISYDCDFAVISYMIVTLRLQNFKFLEILESIYNESHSEYLILDTNFVLGQL